MELIHGGDTVGYQLRYGRRPLDFSASLNPLGMPDAVKAAAKDAVDDSFAYPDPLCRALSAALARHLAVPESYICCGNGAADIIHRLVQAVGPKTALVLAPTFAEYERALNLAGCAVEHHYLSPKNGFVLGDDILSAIRPGLDIAFLCQPNNPTGRLADPALVSAMLDRSAATGTRLFVDECFCHFVDEPERHSLVGRTRRFANLFILDSFTKLYGMAGIRLGYGVSGDAGLIESLSAAGQPWPVSTVAQAAGAAALGETEYVRKSRLMLPPARQTLTDGLATLGNTVLGGDANFIFFHSPASELGARLMREGILIRDCGNFRGLGPGYYRVAVRLEEENALLLRALYKAMNG